MPVVRAKITSKGQITLPVELRRHLDLESGDEVSFSFGDDERAELVPVRRRSIMTVSGAFAGSRGPSDWEDIRRRAWRGRGRELERRVAGRKAKK